MAQLKNIFKAYDIRGVYSEELTDEIAYKFGRAFVTHLKCKNVVVGHDMRKSSESIEKNLIKGITDQGADVIRIGLSTTPMLYFSVIKLKKESGINITASHNPGKYNGFKLVRKEAVPISGDTGIYEMRDLVEKGKFTEPVKKGKVIESKGILKDYVDNTFSFVDASKIKKFKVVFDTGNGMAGLVLPELVKHLNIESKSLFPELDGDFPNHEANPLKEETLEDLKKEVIKTKADIGIAFDGDSDRVGFVDEKGKFVPADRIAALVSREILKENKNERILYDLRSSKILPETIEEYGGTAIETRVGHSYIKEHMRKEKAIFGSELSAHFYLRENNYCEAPYVVPLLILKIMSEEGKKFSELIKPLNKYYQTGEMNFEVKDKEEMMKKAEAYFKEKALKISHLDGLKMTFKDWWFNLRPSNTESLLRLNLEAETKELMEKKKKEVIAVINS